MMDDEPYQRPTTHTRLGIHAEVSCECNAPFTGPVRDVSVNGVYVYCDGPLPVGRRCAVRLVLEDNGAEPFVNARGTIVRSDENGAVIEFNDIDLNSFDHLRQLALCSTSDTG